MKKSKFLYAILLLCIFATACEKEEDRAEINSNPTAAQLINPSDDSVVEITESNVGDSLVISWKAADYGVQTEVTYQVEMIGVDGSFESPIVLGTAFKNSLTISRGDLNMTILVNLSGTPNVETATLWRIKSAVNDKYIRYSEPASIAVNSFEVVSNEPPKLWVPGGYQGFDPPSAPVIYELEDNIFEGYFYISEGTGVKFTSAPDYQHTNYGFDSDGILTTDPNATDISVPVSGFYRFHVDIAELTYEINLITTWGVIGTATPGLWDSSTAMDLDVQTGICTLTLDMANGALKFRANDDWGINFGPNDSSALEGKLIQTDAAITIPEAGNYTVEIDLSRSEPPYEYSYSVTPN